VTSLGRRSHRSRGRRQSAPTPVRDWRAAGVDLSEMSEPDDLLFPDDRWPKGRPEYVIVIAQRAGLRGQQPSLAEVLRTRVKEPEPDLEAEP
jgi:hypothetical protein